MWVGKFEMTVINNEKGRIRVRRNIPSWGRRRGQGKSDQLIKKWRLVGRIGSDQCNPDGASDPSFHFQIRQHLLELENGASASLRRKDCGGTNCNIVVDNICIHRRLLNDNRLMIGLKDPPGPVAGCCLTSPVPFNAGCRTARNDSQENKAVTAQPVTRSIQPQTYYKYTQHSYWPTFLILSYLI